MSTDWEAQEKIVEEYWNSFEDELVLTEEDKRMLYDGSHPRFRFCTTYSQYGKGQKLRAKDMEWAFHSDGTYSTKISFTDGRGTYRVTLTSKENPHKDPIAPWLNMPDKIGANDYVRVGSVVPAGYKRYWVSEPEYTSYCYYTL